MVFSLHRSSCTYTYMAPCTYAHKCTARPGGIFVGDSNKQGMEDALGKNTSVMHEPGDCRGPGMSCYAGTALSVSRYPTLAQLYALLLLFPTFKSPVPMGSSAFCKSLFYSSVSDFLSEIRAGAPEKRWGGKRVDVYTLWSWQCSLKRWYQSRP